MDARLRWFGAVWGITGVVALLLYAVVRLAPIALEALNGPLGTLHYTALLGSLVFFGYTEGYRAFQLQFSPRVVARALSLREEATWPRILLAPAFAMGFFGATRRRMIVSWVLTLGIILLIRLVGATPQPWRGIIDAGVVFALAWGAVAIGVYAVRAVAGEDLLIATDLPAA